MLNIDKKPENTPFRQQRMLAWTPTYGTGGSVCCFVSLAAWMIPVGAVMLVASRDIDRVEIRYDNHEDLMDCPWVKGGVNERCFDYPCEQNAGLECSKQQSCGMVANLPPHCPRSMVNLTLDEIRAAGSSDCDPHCTASVNFTVTETITGPVFIYYKLEKFWQNHRVYVDSRSELQLSGGGSAGSCPPYLHPGTRSNDTWCQEMTSNATWEGYECDELPFYHGSVKQVGALVYAPCGLSAWSRFNDSFTIVKEDGDVLCDGDAPEGVCTKDDISWKSDRDYRYSAPKMTDSTFKNGGFQAELDSFFDGTNLSSKLTPVTRVENITVPYLYHGWYLFEPYHKIPSQLDEDLMVWNKVAMLNKFYKLYRKINSDIPPGTYRVDIKHRFDMSPFGGRKYFVLSTAKWMGAKNEFMAILLMTLGSLCFTVAVMMLVHYICYNKEREEILKEWVQVLIDRAETSRGSGEGQPLGGTRKARARSIRLDASAGASQ